jgi:uncharacterized protein (DUF488 family)
VRSVPRSKIKPEFSREPLAERLAEAGIRYIYMGDSLGGRPPDPGARAADGRIDYGHLRLRPEFERGIESLEAGFEAGERIAIMCSEGKPQECHRTKLVAAELIDSGVPVLHIDETGELRTHEAVMQLLTHGQVTLFGEHATASTSRKQYRVA